MVYSRMPSSVWSKSILMSHVPLTRNLSEPKKMEVIGRQMLWKKVVCICIILTPTMKKPNKLAIVMFIFGIQKIEYPKD